MRQVWSSKAGTRGSIGLMLCLAITMAAGLKWLVPVAARPVDEALIPAVYRFPSGAQPDCGQLSGRASPASPAGELEWVRMGGLGRAAPAATDGKCLTEPIAV